MARGYDSVRIEQNLEGRFQVYVYRTRSAGLGDLRQFGQRIPALEYAMDLGRKTGLPIDDRTEKRTTSQEAALAKHKRTARRSRQVKTTSNPGISSQDIREFRGFLQNATDRQIQGIYDKETEAGRDEYAELAVGEAERRGIHLER